uniref:Fungal_trans domain-containing protein n=1 Tax=Macrostomum lignano TaxID=282301 RepID=A0A1I8JPG7_9PLAT
MNQAPFADSVPMAQTEARSLLDSPCLNQLFCSSALLGSIEDARLPSCRQLPAVASPFDFWRRSTEVAPPRLLRRHLDLYKALAPYDETRLLPAASARSLAMQPAMLLLLSIHYRESPHQTVVEFVRRVLQTDDAEPPSAELRPVHPALQVQLLGLLAYAGILNIDRYEQSRCAYTIPQAPRQRHVTWRTYLGPNTTDEPDLLNDSWRSCIDFRDECFDEFGAGAYNSFVMFVTWAGKDAAHDVADWQITRLSALHHGSSEPDVLAANVQSPTE